MRARIQKLSTPLMIVATGCLGKVNFTTPHLSSAPFLVNAFVSSLYFVSLAEVVLSGATCPSRLHVSPSQNSQFSLRVLLSGVDPVMARLMLRVTAESFSENASLFAR